MEMTFEEQLAQIQAQDQRVAQEIEARMRRDNELIRSDVTVTRAYEAGVPVPAEWVAYRQALRDIPQQPGFPDNIQWPTKPE
jgi:hypothetical protein